MRDTDWLAEAASRAMDALLARLDLERGRLRGVRVDATLTWDDLRAIRTEVPTVRYAAAQLGSAAQLQSEDQNWSTRVYGTTPEFFLIRNWSIVMGSPMSDSDAEGGTKVVLLGQTVVNNLFGPNANPVGQVVRINIERFNKKDHGEDEHP
jgi:putative ABC transport system permease protein